MATNVRYLSPSEKGFFTSLSEVAKDYNSETPKKPVVFLLCLDDTNESISTREHPTYGTKSNVGHVKEMADESFKHPNLTSEDHLRVHYYEGIGSKNENGQYIAGAEKTANGTYDPEADAEAKAKFVYSDFSKNAQNYLNTHPDATPADLSAQVVCAGTGCATMVRVAQMVAQKGLEYTDTINGKEVNIEVAPKGAVNITGAVLFDPVSVGKGSNQALPGSVKGKVLSIVASSADSLKDNRLSFSGDPRVLAVNLPVDHGSVVGGQNLGNASGATLSLATQYLKNSGVNLGQVPEHLKFDPKLPVLVLQAPSDQQSQTPAKKEGAPQSKSEVSPEKSWNDTVGKGDGSQGLPEIYWRKSLPPLGNWENKEFGIAGGTGRREETPGMALNKGAAPGGQSPGNQRQPTAPRAEHHNEQNNAPLNILPPNQGGAAGAIASAQNGAVKKTPAAGGVGPSNHPTATSHGQGHGTPGPHPAPKAPVGQSPSGEPPHHKNKSPNSPVAPAQAGLTPESLLYDPLWGSTPHVPGPSEDRFNRALSNFDPWRVAQQLALNSTSPGDRQQTTPGKDQNSNQNAYLEGEVDKINSQIKDLPGAKRFHRR